MEIRGNEKDDRKYFEDFQDTYSQDAKAIK